MEYTKVKQLIDKGLAKRQERIYRIGVELEGGWKKVPEGIQLEHDGSVQIKILATKAEEVYTDAQIKDAQKRGLNLPDFRGSYVKIATGEIPSMILEPSQMGEWVKKYYPDYVNETCGLHVHMSFKSALHYSRLMTPEFTKIMVSAFTDWANEKGLPKRHPIWGRLAGKSQYCQAKFWADEQARKQHKDHNREAHGNRYTMISYPYSQKGTIECRLLPMMDNAALAVEAIQRVLDVTNACLSVSGARGVDGGKVKVTVPMGDEIFLERKSLHV